MQSLSWLAFDRVTSRVGTCAHRVIRHDIAGGHRCPPYLDCSGVERTIASPRAGDGGWLTQ